MAAIVSMVSGGVVVLTQRFNSFNSGKPVRMGAINGARYVLAEDGAIASGVYAKRVGTSLFLVQHSELNEPSALIIDDFFGRGAQLLGMGTEGEYLPYVAASATGADQVASEDRYALLTLASAVPVAATDALQSTDGGLSGSNAVATRLMAVAGGVALSNDKSDTEQAAPAPIAKVASVLNEGISEASIGTPVAVAVDLAATTDVGELRSNPELDSSVLQGSVGASNSDRSAGTSDANGTGSAHAQSQDTMSPSTAPIQTATFSADSVPVIDEVRDDQGAMQGNVENGGYTDDGRPQLVGKADPGVLVHIYRNSELIGQVYAGADGLWSFMPKLPLADGRHAISILHEYPDGDFSDFSEPYVIFVDKSVPDAPLITGMLDDQGRITGAITDQMVTDDNRPTIDGSAEAHATIIVYDKGKEIGRTTVDADGNWQFTPEIPLADGTHILSYSAVDRAGNSSERSVASEFVVDTRAEKINIYFADDDAGSVTGEVFSGGVTDDTTPTLFGTATAGGIVSIYEGDVLLGKVAADVDGTWQFTPPAALSEGVHAFHATVTLVAKGESERSKPFSLEVDVTAPSKPIIDKVMDDVGAILGLVESGQITDDTTPTLSGKAEKSSTVYVYDNGSLLGEAKVDAEGGWIFTPAKPLLDGSHSFTVKAVDVAGNLSAASNPFAVVIDTIPPVVPNIESIYDDAGPVTGNVAQGSVTDDATPTIKGTAEAGSTVVVMSNGKEVGRAVADGVGQWSFTPLQTAALSSGEHVFTVISIDNAGNASNPSSTFTVKIEAEPPRSVATILSMEKDSGFNSSDWVTNDASAGRLIRGSLNAALGGGEVLQVSTDGGATWSNAVVNGTSWSALDMSSHAQSWEISVRVAASTGLTGAVTSQTVILDQTAPDAPTRVMANEGVCTVTFSDESLRSGDLLDFVSNGKHYQHALTAQEVAAGVAVVSLPSGMVEGVVVGIIDSAGNVSDYRALSLLGSEIFDFDDLTDGQDIGTEYTFGSVTAMGLGWLSGSYYPDYNGGTPTLWLEGQRPFGIHHDTEFRLATPADGVSFYFHTNSSIEPVYVSFHDENGIEIGRLDYVRGPLEPPGFVDFKAPEGTTISSFHYATPFGEWGGGYIDNMVITRNSTGGGIVPPALVHKVVGEDVGFYGGSGNDVFELSSSAFFKNHGANVRGGGGLDTLKFSGAGTMLDLMDIKGEVSSVEVFDIAGSGANMLSLGLSDVLSNGAVDQFYSGSKSHVQLMVVGDGDDVLNLRSVLTGGSGPGHWKDAGQVSIAGVSYQSYQYSAFAAEVLVSRGVSVNVVNAQGMGELQPASAGDGLNEGNVIPLLVQTEDELFSNQVGIQSDYLSVDMSQGSDGSYAFMTNVDRYALHQIESEIY